MQVRDMLDTAEMNIQEAEEDADKVDEEVADDGVDVDKEAVGSSQGEGEDVVDVGGSEADIGQVIEIVESEKED